MVRPSYGFAVEGGWRKIRVIEILTPLVLVDISSIKLFIRVLRVIYDVFDQVVGFMKFSRSKLSSLLHSMQLFLLKQ